MIRWSSVRTDNLHVEYSLDDGLTWTEIVYSVPAYLESLEWKVPNVATNGALVRLTNRERPQFTRQTEPNFTILQAQMTLLGPNGGEKYELREPVTVTWKSKNVTTVRIDFSSDNGATWKTIADEVNAYDGRYTFTPLPIPTKLGLVRVVDVDRNRIQDVSDAPFEIMEAKSIGVLLPAQGDQLVRGSTTLICWSAPRISSVNIFYSSDGGYVWTAVAWNVQSEHGSLPWRVPNELTQRGKIRITEAGGWIVGESGIFSIVDQTVPTLRVIAPNGGEVYTEGDVIPIRWSASPDIADVAISYWNGGEGTWHMIATHVPANQAEYIWSAPAPGTGYRIRIESSTVSDQSDGYFQVVRQLLPKITVIYPNGGEDLKVGDKATVRWNETDLTSGTVTISYSTDPGMEGWLQIATVNLGVGQYEWTVPNDVSNRVLLRVENGSTSDQSDGYFSISAKPIEPIVVTSPNGGEQWMENQTRPITWTSPSDVSQVQISYSTDRGATWRLIASSSSVTGSNSYSWKVPATIPAAVNSALVRIASASDLLRFDVSDNPFTLLPSPLGVPSDPLAGTQRLILLGNYPNPFATNTEIHWIQSSAGEVTLSIYASDGALVYQMAAGRREQGEQKVVMEKGNLASGVYYYEIRCGENAARGTMSILH